jgi:uncharacterized protein
MQKHHVQEINQIGVSTLKNFAQRSSALDGRPAKGSRETFDRLHRQAGVQYEGRVEDRNVHHLLPIDTTISDRREEGLARLPTPSEGDVFFDIEGDRFHEGGGLEYLLGIVFQESGQWKYQAWWGLDRKEEKRAFESLMHFLMSRFETYPDYHIYHFAPYEPSALKHLMLRHSTRAEEVDWLLRGERLIDLHAVVRQSLIASVESYGLKKLEPFFAFERKTELYDARQALLQMQRSLELNIPDGITDEVKEVVQMHNAEDCYATMELRTWLESLRDEYEHSNDALTRPLLKQVRTMKNRKRNAIEFRRSSIR